MPAGAAIEVKIADLERFRSFADAMDTALGLLGGLSDDEKDALPERARDAIMALASACRGMTGITSEAPARDTPEFQGHIVIEWPPPRGTAPVLNGWGVSISDAGTGEPLVNATDVRVHAHAEGWITAELTQLTGPEGQPVRQEPADPGTGRVPPLAIDVGEDGEPKTAVFRYLVAEMRVRQ